MEKIKKNFLGIIICFFIALPAWYLGKTLPSVGGPVFSILIGMIIASFWKDKRAFASGIKFTSKYILQLAVVLLGFGLNLNVILKTGGQSLPIIIATISTSLIVAYIMYKYMDIEKNISILIGAGSSICGGSAIAASAPVIEANDEEVAQSISVIFFFNILAALIFPLLGQALGMSTGSGEAFGIFAGTAVNDTSSVTATASTWDNMWNLGSQTLDKAVTVKLTRTLAIIPICLALAFMKNRGDEGSKKVSLGKIFPKFIIYFVLASVITSLAGKFGIDNSIFKPLKKLSKFFIIMAMAAIGLNTDIVKLIKKSGKPILLGGVCWISISLVSLFLQHLLKLW